MGRKKFSEKECLESLSKASEIVDGKLSKERYRNLDIRPSATVIEKRCGGWNEAKQNIGLDISPSGILEKPDIIDISEKEWKEISKSVRFRKRQQAFVAKEKISSGCKKCGYDKHPSALDYHHKNDKEKFADVSTMVTQGYSTERIQKEIEKCIVLCSNCHKEITNEDVYDVSVE